MALFSAQWLSIMSWSALLYTIVLFSAQWLSIMSWSALLYTMILFSAQWLSIESQSALSYILTKDYKIDMCCFSVKHASLCFLSYFTVYSLYCLFFNLLRLLITPLVSSNFSSNAWLCIMLIYYWRNNALITLHLMFTNCKSCLSHHFAIRYTDRRL